MSLAKNLASWFLGRKGLNACIRCVSSFQVQTIPPAHSPAKCGAVCKFLHSALAAMLEIFTRPAIRARRGGRGVERSGGHVIVAPRNCFRQGLCDGRHPRVRLPQPLGSVPRARAAAAEAASRDADALPPAGLAPAGIILVKTSLSPDSGKGGSRAGMSEAARQSLHAAGYGLRSGAIADLYRKEGLTDTSLALLACL